VEDLKPIEVKLDALIDAVAIVSAKLDSAAAVVPAASRPAYETPVLDVSQVVVDGKTINRDGSVWDVDDGRWSGQKGVPKMVRYGYHSEAKDPVLWAKIKATLGPEAFARWDKRRDPWALYVFDPREYLDSGVANMITLSQLLNAYGRKVQ
jgi:hypothetical protein